MKACKTLTFLTLYNIKILKNERVEETKRMKKKPILALVAAGVIILVLFGFLLRWKAAGPEKVERLRVGLLPDSISALLYIAREQGLFKRHGLDVVFENYQAGAYAVNDLLADKIDVATAIEFVLVLQGFKREDLRSIGTISSSDTIEVIARKDRKIGKPEDLKGKIVGSSKGTATDFFLSTFLSFNNIHPGEIRTVDVKPADVLTALSEGKIDAAVSFSPFSGLIKRSLAGRSLSWPAQGGRDFYYLLITREELVSSRPGVIDNLLRGLLEAEEFLMKHEREAQDMMKRILNIDQEALMSTWSKTRFRVHLDQNLVTLMEDEARWAIRNKLVDAEKIPDYSTFLYLEGLKKIKPEAVGVSY
jgi:ABC-type nitrate/sulfonate/bicarbonate transport system substrate-binding protein